MIENNKHLDLLSSVVLFGLSIFSVFEGFRMTKDSGKALAVSPGLMPIVLGSALALCAVLLFINSIMHVGLKVQLKNSYTWLSQCIKDKLTHNILGGIAILGVYTFLLLEIFPFWLSSIIFLGFILLYLNATTPIKAVAVSLATVAIIVVLFNKIFHVPLP